MAGMRNQFSEATMNRTGSIGSAQEMLERAVDYVSTSGITLSFWILSIVFISGRIFVAP